MIPTPVEIPTTTASFLFGRSLSAAELGHFFSTTGIEGAFRGLLPDSLTVYPDTSGLDIFIGEPGLPWPDIYGAAWFSFDPDFAGVEGRHARFWYRLRGVTWTDAACDTVGPVDPDDWTCHESDWVPGQDGQREPLILPACPNPVTSEGNTTIRVWGGMGAEDPEYRLVLVDTTGVEVRTLLDGPVPDGWNEVVWDLTDDGGDPVPDGFYRAILTMSIDHEQGSTACGGDIFIHTLVGAEPLPSTLTMAMEVNPNPFNPRTTITFILTRESAVKIEVFDMMGRLVKILADRNFSGGDHAVV